MSEYETVLSAAVQLSVAERLRLIDELASTVPDNQPPQLSPQWLAEIEKRAADLDAGAVQADSWEDVRQRLTRITGHHSAR